MNKYEVIKKYLDEYDYYGLLAYGAPDDEFDSYSLKFSNIITESDTEEDIARLLAETMDKAFGNEIRPDKFLNTARKNRKALFEDS